MTIPEPVVRDLLALVEAGEASPETRALVEEYAATHQDFAALLKTAPLFGASSPGTLPDREMESLKRTKQMLRLKSVLLGGAVTCTLVPLSFAFHNGQVTFVFLRDATGAAIGFWCVAAAAWAAFYIVSRSLRTTGL